MINEDQWISVKDKLPEKGQSVLVYAPEMDEPIAIMYYDPNHEEAKDFGQWVSDKSEGRTAWISLYEDDVTHWREIPKPPQK